MSKKTSSKNIRLKAKSVDDDVLSNLLTATAIDKRNDERERMAHADLKDLTSAIWKFVEDANEQASDAVASAGMAILNAWSCGSALIAAKGKVEHGKFEKWVEKEFSKIPLGLRTAQRYMQLARSYTRVEDLMVWNPSVRQAYIACGILPAPPEVETNSDKDSEVIARTGLLKSVHGVQNKLLRFSTQKIKIDSKTKKELITVKAEIDKLFRDLIK